MLSKILKREWVTIMNNVFDISLNVLVDCVNEKKDFSLLIKEYTKNAKLNNYKKTCLSICGIVLRNYYLIKYFANHVLKFTDTRLVLATGIVFGTVAFKKVEDTLFPILIIIFIDLLLTFLAGIAILNNLLKRGGEEDV